MYLYLGRSVSIPQREILAVFDLDNASWAYKTREFLERAEREGRAVWLTSDLPRSFILAGDGRSLPTVYISPLSTATLKSRVERNSFE